MTRVAIRAASVIVAALVVGAMFGIWLGFNPSTLSSGAYVEQQQQAIRSLNVIMPLLGALAIALALLSAVKAGGVSRALLLGAALCFVASGLVTRFGNQPINRGVMTWSAQPPPADWRVARDEWWRWHIIRTGTGTVRKSIVSGALESLWLNSTRLLQSRPKEETDPGQGKRLSLARTSL